MQMAFIVKNGRCAKAKMLPPPNICHHVEGVAHKFIVHCSISFLFSVEVCELYKLCHKNQLLI